MRPLSPSTEAKNPVASDLQFLTFFLANEEYGVDILKVQEIKGYSAITAIPRTQAHVKGVMNLRGVVVPVVDLRQMLGLERADIHRRTVVVVVNVASRVVALIVDSVSDVLKVPRSELEPAPDLGSRVDTSFVTGIAKRPEHMVIVLDLEKLLLHEDLGVLAA